jgi:hypothetical protein
MAKPPPVAIKIIDKDGVETEGNYEAVYDKDTKQWRVQDMTDGHFIPDIVGVVYRV